MGPIEFEQQNVVFAKDQPEYLPLPAHVQEDGTVTTIWKLTEDELAEINKTGKIRIQVLTFNHPLQPIRISVLAEGQNPII